MCSYLTGVDILQVAGRDIHLAAGQDSPRVAGLDNHRAAGLDSLLVLLHRSHPVVAAGRNSLLGIAGPVEAGHNRLAVAGKPWTQCR